MHQHTQHHHNRTYSAEMPGACSVRVVTDISLTLDRTDLSARSAYICCEIEMWESVSVWGGAETVHTSNTYTFRTVTYTAHQHVSVFHTTHTAHTTHSTHSTHNTHNTCIPVVP